MPVSQMKNTIEEAQSGNENAISQLMQEWYKPIYNLGYKYFSDHTLAMEIAQKTFIVLHNKIGSLKSQEGFKSWLFRIAINHCHEEERKLKRFERMDSKDGLSNNAIAIDQMVAREFDPEKSYQKEEIMEFVALALLRIPVDQKEIVIMKAYQGMKFKEIAEILEIPVNTVKSRLYYGLKSLKTILTEMNVHLDSFNYEI